MKKEEKHNVLSDLFVQNLKKLFALRPKYGLKIKKEKVQEINKELQVYPPHIEKITQEFYLNNDDIIPIVQKAFFRYMKK
jgi:hypothetical protein